MTGTMTYYFKVTTLSFSSIISHCFTSHLHFPQSGGDAARVWVLPWPRLRGARGEWAELPTPPSQSNRAPAVGGVLSTIPANRSSPRCFGRGSGSAAILRSSCSLLDCVRSCHTVSPHNSPEEFSVTVLTSRRVVIEEREELSFMIQVKNGVHQVCAQHSDIRPLCSGAGGPQIWR